MALRELFAQLDVKVDGAEELEQADATMNVAAKSANVLQKATKGTAQAFKEGAHATKAFADGAVTVGKATYTVADAILSMSERVSNASNWVKGLAAAFFGLGLVLTTTKMWGFIAATTEAVDETGKLATTLGVTVEGMQRWQHVAKTSGASNEDLLSTFKTLATQMQAAQGGSEGAVKAFKDLNIEIEESPGKLRGLEDVLIDVSAALASTEDQSTKLGLTQTLLSETALKMLPGFKGTTEEMRAQLLTMDELAGVYSEEFVRAAEATNDELHFMGNQFSVLKAGIVSEFLPSFRVAISFVSKITASFRSFLKETDLLNRWIKVGALAGFLRFSGLIARHWGTLATWAGRFVRFLAPVARVIARFAAWALILDDIIVFLQGGDSALGALLNKIFGIGTAQNVLDKFRFVWDAVAEGIRLAGEVLGWLWDDFKSLLADIDAGGTAWDNWGGGAGKAIKAVISGLKDLFAWLDKVTGLTDALKDIADTIFQADDERMNREAIMAAQDRAKQAGAQVPGGAAPSVRSNTSNYTDNSRVSVTLTGAQTPDTVSRATSEAKNLRSSRARANALVRGAT